MYTEAFARFILECKAAWEELCERIESGDVPGGERVRLQLDIPCEAVDAIRSERLSMIASNGNGNG